MSGPEPARPRRRRDFARDEGGAYAIEFAFFGMLLLAVILILFQYAVIHLARQNLNTSLQVATRALLTGTFQNANGPALTQAKTLENLRAIMCGGTGSHVVFYKCDNLKVTVQIASAASNAWNVSAVDPATKDWRKGFGTGYQCPPSQSTATVIAAVKLPLIAPLALTLGMASFHDGAVALQAASVFKVEPFERDLAGGC